MVLNQKLSARVGWLCGWHIEDAFTCIALKVRGHALTRVWNQLRDEVNMAWMMFLMMLQHVNEKFSWMCGQLPTKQAFTRKFKGDQSILPKYTKFTLQQAFTNDGQSLRRPFGINQVVNLGLSEDMWHQNGCLGAHMMHSQLYQNRADMMGAGIVGPGIALTTVYTIPFIQKHLHQGLSLMPKGSMTLQDVG